MQYFTFKPASSPTLAFTTKLIKKTMGAFLDRPITDKEIDTHENKHYSVGLATCQGWRAEMEDSHVIALDVREGLSFFAVFDGHAGKYLSKAIADPVSGVLSDIMRTEEYVSGSDDPYTLARAMKKGFLAFDERIREICFPPNLSGCTGIAVFVTSTYIICANTGDSRCVLSRNKIAKAMSFDHKPDDPEEKKRIYNAGGHVLMKRVNGNLAVSRAFGDFQFKLNMSLSAELQQVTALPDLLVVARKPTDNYLVLACDGIWDVMTNQECVDFLGDEMLKSDDLSAAAVNLIDKCLIKQSRDNMSVLLVRFNKREASFDEDKIDIEKPLDGYFLEEKTSTPLHSPPSSL